MGLVRGEDFTFIANFDNEEFDVSDIQNARLSIANRGTVVHHGMNELVIDTEANEVRYEISQANSLAFSPNSQINFELNLLTSDKRHCVVKFATNIEDTLLDELLGESGQPVTADDIIAILIQGESMDGKQRRMDFVNDRVQVVNEYRFVSIQDDFKSITLPNVLVCYDRAFAGCKVDVIRLARCNRIYGNGVFVCRAKEIYIPSLRINGYSGTDNNFSGNHYLEVLDSGQVLPMLNDCWKLTTLILHAFVEPSSTDVFQNTPFDVNRDEWGSGSQEEQNITDDGGYAYVPSELLAQFNASTAWQTYAHVIEFRAIEGSEYE